MVRRSWFGSYRLSIQMSFMTSIKHVVCLARTPLEYNSHWAKSYLKKGGAVENSTMGVWSITDLGEKMSEEEVLAIPAMVRKDYAAKRKDKVKVIEEEESYDFPAAENDDWQDELLQILLALKPDAFERLCQRLLRESGFSRVEVTGKSSDGGIDGVGVLRVNLLSFQVSFQCKRYQGSVGSSVIRDFRGAMVGRSDKGLVITTGTFTSEARKEAVRDGAPAIDLIDGEEMCNLLRKEKLGITTEIIEKVVISKDWYESI